MKTPKWGALTASWHYEVRMKAHVQEGFCELLNVKGSRVDAGTISANVGPQELVR